MRYCKIAQGRTGIGAELNLVNTVALVRIVRMLVIYYGVPCLIKFSILV